MDDQQTAPERACLTARLRDVAEYSFDREIVERMKTAAYFQDQQRALLLLASHEIDRLRMTKQERAAIACAVAFLAPVSNYDSLTQDTLRNLLERTA